MRKGRGSLIPTCKKAGLSLPTFQSGCSDLLQGEDEASLKHLSALFSLASHHVLSLQLSVDATGLRLGSLLVSFNAAIQHPGSSRPPSLLRDG